MIFIPLFTSTEGIKKHICEIQKRVLLTQKQRLADFLPKIRIIFLALAVFGLIIPTPSKALSGDEEFAEEEDIERALGEQCAYLPNAANQKISLPLSEQKLPPVPDAPVRTMKVSATAYSSTVGQTDGSPFITASGEHVRDGIIAANFLAFGTRVRIPDYFGDKEFVVADRLAPRFQNRIDVWFPEYHQAKQFGIKRSVRLEILD